MTFGLAGYIKGETKTGTKPVHVAPFTLLKTAPVTATERIPTVWSKKGKK